MIGLDTNILARYYIEDQSDNEAQKQRLLAKDIIESTEQLYVAKTVLLEFEWVMRGFYQFNRQQISSVFEHISTLSHIKVEDEVNINQALQYYEKGLDFADAIHLVSYSTCEKIYSFDDKKFSRKAAKLKIQPEIIVPK
ncbi:PIN domain-containing protein [Acinetobacter sp. 2JN-4]|uniref:type II toxin-antitoxin system VapC family toxin n=1 Tax=Acinetobacter sp. 2JN-4 TaxID=2479844 RepID=UPI000EF980B4|nr:type II toxin-antitoxin system VapC family toxin [Acinetobacter sp. 2JN-4]RLZ10852.1 PIN domain-containing protein [Acinetobacter sp. 2JN-4]